MNKNFNDLAQLIARVGFGALMLTHGIPKIGMLSNPSEFADPLGIGGTLSLILVLIAEVIAPVLVIIGFKTKLATIPIILTMLTAALVFHSQDPFGVKEKALLYVVAFTVILLAGPGKYAIDKKG
ncbi:DoxX family protein [Xanthomarina sp.]|uniref:DoxX family protein n=1 Tax=Xanthomarina sp. TaxID=1931211 RepID=UPI002C28108C|nr:DoxX family protein [Xanthomarina sp.]HLV39705.1 DoxX family protein [Xanthomarina sp.]